MRPAERDGHGVVAKGPAASARHGHDVLGSRRDVACRATAAVVECRSACGVLEDTAVRSPVPIAPDEQSVNDGPEVEPRGGQLVEVPSGVPAIGLSLEDPVIDEPGQAI